MLIRSAKNMTHKELADKLVLRASYLATELVISEFAVRFTDTEGDVDFIPIQTYEVEGRIRGYVYEGFNVEVEVIEHTVTIIAKDS